MIEKKKIAITLGDPAGIGAEVVLKSLLSEEVCGICKPVLVGDTALLNTAAKLLSVSLDKFPIEIVETGAINSEIFLKNKPSAEGGKAAVSYIKKAVELALSNKADAIVTAPITKESLKMAGYSWPGHTEMLAELTNTKDYAMMLCGGPLNVVLVTIHTAIKNVPLLITKDSVLKTIMLAQKACGMMGIKEPKIAVAGLNPHAGESGMFGDEEQNAIIPAVEEAQKQGVPVSGPYPPDTLFHKAYKKEFDIVVCMYHDQGLIPLKMIAFDRGVNVTVGLPFVRTSPDHGTAYDIAWKGIASPSSMIEAIKKAAGFQPAAFVKAKI
ncbi:MAG: 4-hydroxythreonine-4-phosphate dehydrogenase PdxA [Nitrospirae bacterium]|nr:MAG: 4-hydroxythreonine-4-phosphate dehydrogenase PdxA [Nitrospirota bacterium]